MRSRPTRASVPPALAPWPSVGRAAELDRAVAACKTGSGALICGVAGIGKSDLARRVLAEVASPSAIGCHVITLHATQERARVPLDVLEPLIEALDRSAAGPAAVAAAVASRLDELADGRPVVVHVEDGHLLDRTSAEVIALLSRVGRVRVLITQRSGHNLAPTLADLVKDGGLERIDLAPFDLPSFDRLLHVALDGDVVRDATLAFWKASSGIPFQAREAVRDALDSGQLTETGGVWSATLPLRPGPRLADLVAADLALLGEPERTVVEFVALAEPVPLGTLGQVVADGALDEAVRHGLVVIGSQFGAHAAQAATATIVHPLYGEAIRDQVLPGRRRQLFRSLAEATEAADVAADGRPPSLHHLLRSVSWSLECGEIPPVGRVLDAAHGALAIGDTDYPIRMAGLALDLLDADDPRRVDALVVRARAWRSADRPTEAGRDLADAATQLEAMRCKSDRADDQTHIARALEIAGLRADLTQYHGDDVDGALETLTATVSRLTVGADDGTRRRLDATITIDRLARLGYAGRFDQSVPASLDLLERGHLDATQRLPLIGPLMLGLGQQGRFALALELGSTALPDAVAHALELPWTLGEILSCTFEVHLWSGDLEAIERPWPEETDDEDDLLRFDRAVQQIGSGQRAAAHGRWTEARTEYRSAIARLTSQDQTGLLAFALALQAVAAAAVGDVADASALRDRCIATPLRGTRVIHGPLRTMLAQVGLALRDRQAPAALRCVADDAFGLGQHHVELMALHALLATSADAEGDSGRSQLVERARVAGAQVEGPIGPAVLAHIDAIAGGDDASASLAAATVRAMGVWIPSASTQVALSRREWEVAAMAGRGLSTRHIAEALHVSARTVDSHLAHVYVKLGINRRAELAAALAITAR